jgi:hypothetical protein
MKFNSIKTAYELGYKKAMSEANANLTKEAISFGAIKALLGRGGRFIARQPQTMKRMGLKAYGGEAGRRIGSAVGGAASTAKGKVGRWWELMRGGNKEVFRKYDTAYEGAMNRLKNIRAGAQARGNVKLEQQATKSMQNLLNNANGKGPSVVFGVNNAPLKKELDAVRRARRATAAAGAAGTLGLGAAAMSGGNDNIDPQQWSGSYQNAVPSQVSFDGYPGIYG